MSMRIIAGKHKGRRIELGKGEGIVRPTSDFAREAMFNILSHGKYSDSFIGKPVLDVFCGTGAFGLEALSRGAARAVFIDQSREALAVARQNAQRMHEDNAEFILADATKLGKSRHSYALVFLDPPYSRKLIEPALASLANGGWVDAQSLLVIEHDTKESLLLPESFQVVDERRYGRATVKLMRLIAP